MCVLNIVIRVQAFVIKQMQLNMHFFPQSLENLVRRTSQSFSWIYNGQYPPAHKYLIRFWKDNFSLHGERKTQINSGIRSNNQ